MYLYDENLLSENWCLAAGFDKVVWFVMNMYDSALAVDQ